MKCDDCKKQYRGQTGYTIKNMRRNKIINHYCSIWCLMAHVEKGFVTDIATISN